MTDLVERYVAQVGRYLPQGEREEIQNELRSLIQDQLDDRYKGAPTGDDVVELLTEFGQPRKMAASYRGDQYLIGPELYPTMMQVLQRGWLWIPALVVIIRLLVAFIAGEPGTLIGLLLETAFTVVQAVFVFSGIVVLIFAILQHSGEELDEVTGAGEFDPRELPKLDTSGGLERGEVAFGIAFNIFLTFIFTYFLRVGGLTLRFNLSDPVDVLPVPTNWLIVYIGTLLASIVIGVLALRRDRWTVGLLLAEMAVEAVGAVAAYFVVIQPLFGWLFEALPFMANLPFAGSAPEIVAVFLGFATLADTFSKLVKVATGGKDGRPFISIQPEG